MKINAAKANGIAKNKDQSDPELSSYYESGAESESSLDAQLD